MDYKSHHSVDSLAFGHCEYSYRNLGRPSRIAIRQSKDTFRVDVDSKLCFESSKVSVPAGYQLGVTAASAENADSFEVFKFVTTTENMTPDTGSSSSGSTEKKGTIPIAKKAWGSSGDTSSSSSAPDDIPDEAASAIPESRQFADLHDRLQAMMKHIGVINREVSVAQGSTATRITQLEEKVTALERAISKLDSLAGLDKKLSDIQSDVQQTKRELHNAVERGVAGLKSEVREGHRTMLGSLPGVMGYILVGIMGQGLTVVGYLVYKRRKNAGPKKYL